MGQEPQIKETKDEEAFPTTRECLYRLNGTLMNTNKELARIAVALEKIERSKG